jgi:hypothetical protein
LFCLLTTLSLLQPHEYQKQGERYLSSLSRFLRTVINRPDLAAHVTVLNVWMWKGKAVGQQAAMTVQSPDCTRGDCKHKLSVAVDRLHLTPHQKEKWSTDLLHPTDAMVIGLILAALSNVHTIALYARPSPIREGPRADFPALSISRVVGKRHEGLS